MENAGSQRSLRFLFPMLERIVSLEPSITATLCALDQQHKLVGVTRYCARLCDVAGIPQVEITWSLDADQVVALQPDLVIAGTPYRAGKIDELLQRKIPVLCLYPQSLNDVYNNIDWLGRLCGVSERSQALIGEMQATLAALVDEAKAVPRQRVYVETWPNPLFTGEPWIAEIVAALGSEFVPMPPGRQVTEAEVLAADPEVIVLNWAGVEKLEPDQVYQRPGWQAVSAVRNRRVVAVDEIALNAPGPTLTKGMHELWRALRRDA
jgi:iron complex transport system substrate-binding protein